MNRRRFLIAAASAPVLAVVPVKPVHVWEIDAWTPNVHDEIRKLTEEDLKDALFSVWTN